MVVQKIYFGVLAIEVHCPRYIDWRPFEKKFFVPVMPVRRTIQVEVDFVKELPKAQGDLIYSSESVAVYSGKGERYYTPIYTADQRISTYSCLEGDRVFVRQIADCMLWTNPNFYLLASIHLEQLLLETNGLILHSCYTEYRGQAILFTAPSGTGKTTQAELWKRIYGSSIVNGDKCILQQIDNNTQACGFFFHGSAEECENKTMPIRAIVIVRQSETDFIEELTPSQKIALLYSEITVNTWDSDSVLNAIDLLQKIISETTVVMLHCTMQESAAHVLHHYLYGD